MQALPADRLIGIPDFNEHKDVHLRVSPRFYLEGGSSFKLSLKYKIVKVYEESKSEPIPMSISKLLKMKCLPPFKIEFDYEIKDWLTNELNIKDYEANESVYESFIKLPVNELVPLAVTVTSVSEDKPMTVESVDLAILKQDLIKKVSRTEFISVDAFEKGDSICTGFIIQPLKCENDTGQYGDVLIEWSRESTVGSKTFRNI